MNARSFSIVISLVFSASLSACHQTADKDPSLSRGQYFVTTEDGFYEFYIGKVVADQVAETGTYAPQVEDWYSVITVPVAAVTEAVADEPITLSLCDPSNNITLFDHVFVGPEKIAKLTAQTGEVSTGDTHYAWTPEGELMQTYKSGDQGVYGFAQVVQLDDGSLASAAAADFWIDFGHGSRGGGMLLGLPTMDDPQFEDPLLEDGGCKVPN